MFTGIIEETGKIQTITQNKITVQANIVLEGTKRQCVYKDGTFKDMLQYSILKDEFILRKILLQNR